MIHLTYTLLRSFQSNWGSMFLFSNRISFMSLSSYLNVKLNCSFWIFDITSASLFMSAFGSFFNPNAYYSLWLERKQFYIFNLFQYNRGVEATNEWLNDTKKITRFTSIITWGQKWEINTTNTFYNVFLMKYDELLNKVLFIEIEVDVTYIT